MAMAEDRSPSAAVARDAGARAEPGCSFLLATTVALLIARLPLMAVRQFDNDEFEHAHAAWSLFRGLLPYRDFFEHHTPWYYFMLAPFFRWFAVDQSFESARHFLIFGRVLSFAMTVLATVLVFLIGRLAATRRVGLLAALFFVGQPMLIHKTLEIRPDVPAVLFFTGALWCLRHGLRAADRGSRHLAWFAGGGLCLGAAVMCTQKLLFVLPGTALGLALWVVAGGRRAWLARAAALLVVGVGLLLPPAATWVGFALHDGARQFVFNNFILNAHWRVRSGRHLSNALITSWPILLLCAAGVWTALFRRDRHQERDPGDVLFLCIFAGVAAGIAVVPAAYEQYYLPLLTIACLFAARGLNDLLNASRHHGRAWLVVAATLPLLVWPIVDLCRGFARRGEVVMARVQFVYAHTRPTDIVLDGWLGTGVFRPAASYYYFIHSELWAMLTPAQKAAYVDALTSGRVRPALVTLDDELRAIGPRFMQWLHRNYASDDGVFYLPR
jgi:hypothetical protein